MAAVATARPQLDAEELFDDVGPAYEAAFRSQIQDRSVAWVIDKLKDKKPAKILDVGSGTGKPVCSSFADVGHDVLGIDMSTVMIEHARKAVPNAKFEKADLLQYQVPNGTFDAITVYFSMIAGMTQDQIRETIAKFYGWIKPGGLFIFATVKMSSNMAETDWLGRHFLASSLSADEALTAIQKAGFTVLDKEEELFVPKAVEVGLCKEGQVWPEPWIFVYSVKPE